MTYALYFHIPFCAHRCAYCDFNTYAGQEGNIPAYVNALCNEIQVVGQYVPRGERIGLASVFFGGGTPSLLTPSQFSQIFAVIHATFDLLPGAEISLEANPGTVSRAALEQLRAVGFNRISFGVQSANPEELRLLERIHSFSDVVDALTWARQAGFDNLNLDLMYGLPEQTLERWQKTVELVLGLRPEHVSAYALTLEHGTPFGRWAARGLLPLPNPDLAADMAEWLAARLQQAGYGQYEISNWALAGRECRHNLQYWRNLPYLGLGAGAHGWAAGVRYSNVLRIKTYIERLREVDAGGRDFPLSPAAVNQARVSRDDEMDETMLTGLRLLREGVSRHAFTERFGLDLEAVYGPQIARFTALGLLEWGEVDNLRLTRRGWLVSNPVFMEFLRGVAGNDS